VIEIASSGFALLAMTQIVIVKSEMFLLSLRADEVKKHPVFEIASSGFALLAMTQIVIVKSEMFLLSLRTPKG